MALSITWICSPSCFESAVILPTFSPVIVTFSSVRAINLSVSSMEAVIFDDVSSRCIRASSIWLEDDLVSVLNVLICSATTAKPLPASPARAASMEALSARRLVCPDMLWIVPVSSLTLANSVLKSCRTSSTSEESCDIV